MLLISPENEYPRFIGDLQLAHPEYKKGDTLPDGWTEVAETEMPPIENDEVIYQEFPVEVDGVMTQNWKVRKLTAEEIERRDAPETAKQKLRDLGLTDLEIEALVRGLI